MEIRDSLMKLVVKVHDVVELAKRFEASPTTALREFSEHVRQGAREVLEKVMDAEIELFLGRDAEVENKRNGYRSHTFVLKGLGSLKLRVPRDRLGRFESNVVPSGRRYDEALEKDLALLHLAGLSTRMLSHVSRGVLGLSVSPAEVSSALKTIVPAAKAFLERDISGRRFKYLWIDGTNFRIRRTTVAREPTLVVIGVDENNRKSVLAMVQGDKDARSAWDMVFASLKERGLDGSAVQLGIMDGLPGLADSFMEAFPKARVARCWVHKLRNVEPLVPRRYQAEFKRDWDKVAYADDRSEAMAAFVALKQRWSPTAGDAIERFEKDLDGPNRPGMLPPTPPRCRKGERHFRAARALDGLPLRNRRARTGFDAWPTGKTALLRFKTHVVEWRLVADSGRRVIPRRHPGVGLSRNRGGWAVDALVGRC